MRTLLLADENITVQRVIALTFAAQPIRVVTASDGQQAVDRMTAERPDIVLAGTSLPFMSGYELARLIRNTPEWRDIPVLLLSGAFETVDAAELQSSGASGVIEKPVEPTTVISRVKELLGLKAEAVAPAPAAGRLITPDGPAPERRPLPPNSPPRAVTSTRGSQSAPGQNARSAGDTAKRDDYLETLDEAFDTLDQQLSGRRPAVGQPQHRNPSGPIGQTPEVGDPRSPGRRPPAGGATGGNPVYEVDDEWFAEESKRRDEARAGRREIVEELQAPELQMSPRPVPAAPEAVYEVDDEWFNEDEKSREARQIAQRDLAAEMGIHDVDLPERTAAAAPAENSDLEFGEDDLKSVAPPVVAVAAPVAAPVVAATPPAVVVAPPVVVVAPPPPPPPPPPPAPVEEVIDLTEELSAPELPAEPARTPEPEADPEPEPEPEPVLPPEPETPVATLVVSEVRRPLAPPVVEAEPPILNQAPAEPEFAPEPVARTLPISLWEFGGMNKPPAKPVAAAEPVAPAEPAAPVAPVAPDAPVAPAAPAAPFAPLAPLASAVPAGSDLADDFAALLAYEQGEYATPPMVMPVIHTVTPEITSEMLEQIATTVAERLRGHVHVEPVAPVITGEMLEQVAVRVSERLRSAVKVETVAPQITDEMLRTISGRVADQLQSAVKVETVAPDITDQMLEQISSRVAQQLHAAVKVETVAPAITGEMLDQISNRVAEQLKASVKVEAVAPEISGDMLEHVAHRISERFEASMLGDRLRESIGEAVKEIVRSVVSETSERLVREEIERVKAQAGNQS